MDNFSHDKLSFSSVSFYLKENKKIGFVAVAVVIFFLLIYYFAFSAPSDFPPEAVIQIGQGMNLRSVSLELKQQHIIRSRVAFEAFVILYGGEKHIYASDYLFEESEPVYEIARRIAQGEHHTAPIVVTIPEGFDTSQIVEAFSTKLVNFDKDKFLVLAKEKEGYLFPDTYYFFSTDNEMTAFSSMTNNFNRKIKPILPEILSSGKSEQEIITMASVVEREAKGDADRGIISGILWRRISLGMPLQVDAAPETYKSKGLPKSPISNPGVEAIKAAIHPQASEFLYYLHDKNGEIHYARTFSEHVANKKRYLGKNSQ